MNFKRFHESKNLFDDFDIVGQVPSVSNGNLVNSAVGGTTSFIKMGSAEIVLSYNAIANIYLFLYDNDSQFIGYKQKTDGEPIYSTSISGYSNAVYCRVRVDNLVDFSNANLMLNLGSTSLPYEPYSSEVWHDTPHYIHNTSTDTITTLPAVLYPNAATATVGLKGNMSQSGTPTPTSPIQPSECGDITANMLSVYKKNYSINANGVETYNNVAMIYKAEVAVTGSTFTLDFGGLSTGDAVRIHAYTGDTWQEQVNAINIEQVPYSFTVGSNIDNIRISIRKTATDVAMTDGQYKIPISSANTTTPVYLGEVETTRKIYKYEFKGSETWSVGSENYYSLVPETSGDGVPYSSVICSHCSGSTINSTGKALFVKKSEFPNITTGAELKQFCADQYSAGTPVCVWYVLATPQTAVVNEPLRKIGDYADTVSGISIPTIAGANTLSVDTTLQPSEVTVNYNGWHPIQNVHEAENGQWD